MDCSKLFSGSTITRLAVGLCLLLGTPGGEASARTPRRPPPPERAVAADQPWHQGVTARQRKDAGKLVKEAAAVFAKNDYAKALELYREAIGHWEHPAIRFNIAECLVSLERHLEAYEEIQKALKYDAAPFARPEHYQQALAYKKLLEGRLARLTVRCVEPAAVVSVDGQEWFTGPGEATRTLLAGKHQVVATKTKYVTVTRTFELQGGSETSEELKLIELKTLVRQPIIEMRRRWKKYLPWTVLGVGLAVAVAGVPLLVQGVLEIKQFDRYIKNTCSQPQPDGLPGCLVSDVPKSVTDHESRGKSLAAASYALFSIGGAAVVAGVALVLLNRAKPVEVESPPLPDPRGLTVLPFVLPGGGGLTAAGRF
jgi:hypothetical protein